MAVTRTVQISSDDLSDLNEALAWVLKHHDRELEDCPAFTIHIEKNQRCPNGRPETDEWEPFYTAIVSGVFEDYDEDGDETVESDNIEADKTVEKE